MTRSWLLAESKSVMTYFVMQSADGGNSFLCSAALLIGLDFLSLDVLVEIQFQCPHCGETITSTADTSQGDYSTIEDCEVCCSPMNLEIICEPGRVEQVLVTPA